MALTRKDVMDAVKATEPQDTLTPADYIYAVMNGIGGIFELDKWPQVPSPVWSAFWRADDADCGFVSRIIVNDPTTFFSTDSQGRDRRLPVAGKKFYALPQRGG